MRRSSATLCERVKQVAALFSRLQLARLAAATSLRSFQGWLFAATSRDCENSRGLGRTIRRLLRSWIGRCALSVYRGTHLHRPDRVLIFSKEIMTIAARVLISGIRLRLDMTFYKVTR